MNSKKYHTTDAVTCRVVFLLAPFEGCQLTFTCFRKSLSSTLKSRGFFIDGQSPFLLAARVTSRWYGLTAAKDFPTVPIFANQKISFCTIPPLLFFFNISLALVIRYLVHVRKYR